MNTCWLTTAAEDFTGPAVLNFQTGANFSGSGAAATPRRSGPPWNIGQSPAGQAIIGASSSITREAHLAALRMILRTGSTRLTVVHKSPLLNIQFCRS